MLKCTYEQFQSKTEAILSGFRQRGGKNVETDNWLRTELYTREHIPADRKVSF